jgi:long-chain acyl-CoA synthetase
MAALSPAARVFGVPDEHWGEAVHALVVLHPGFETAPDELIEFGRRSLATFKVPKQVEFRTELFKGPTGKIQKREHKAEYRPGTP